jgi:hypothetical protein
VAEQARAYADGMAADADGLDAWVLRYLPLQPALLRGQAVRVRVRMSRHGCDLDRSTTASYIALLSPCCSSPVVLGISSLPVRTRHAATGGRRA